ncbi:DNA polymerase V [Komagataella phaffii CBS 7435]|uniref:DNA polymerase V n=2 Tax=Komagataella phaffii TaxID=460519 RepID=C4R176_KOMPG|nr:uncharacterized protein PAS_chr2-1_0868 [Komagataella phaffii GS115]AOA62029.1 GQ67_00671T0 [Komagataella phaffii]CAH2448223.1 DNA polymerase V [Komagataella phaffii CBS 7435]AOA67367.1 GQ68_00717T0 [Komagataella phaffii GS115]CAY69250.1 hypothetical protein PAS_chr2-1_0868 [Komagataella phaffii GS115]CCA38358.1 DNA polymerase V [Komagataella phaffii CBS 7435]
MSSVSLDHYYYLASDLEEERIKGASSLLKELVEADNQKDYDYALNRLIKGLSSERASSRVGFSLALSELIVLLIGRGDITVESYLNELYKVLEKVAPNKHGKIDKQTLFGKLFGIQALLNSKIVKNDDYSTLKMILRRLLKLSSTKPWLRETCFSTICSLLVQYDLVKDFEIINYLLSTLLENKVILSLEGILVHLTIPWKARSKLVLSTDAYKQNGDQLWSQGNPLMVKNLPQLSLVLRQGAVDEDQKGKQRGWTPNLHTVWTLIIDELINTSIDEPPKKKKKSKERAADKEERLTLERFWAPIIDENFFSSDSSSQKKYWGFSVLLAVLEHKDLKPSHVKFLFSPNLMANLIHQSANNDRQLNKMARKVLARICEICKEAEFVVPTLKTLLRHNVKFDRMSKTKTISTIIDNSDGFVMDEVTDFIINWANTLQPDYANFLQDYLSILDQLLHFVRDKKGSLSTTNITWVQNIVDHLIKVSFFKVPNTQEFEAISNTAYERLISILSEVLSQPPTDGSSWPTYIVNKLVDLEKNSGLQLRHSLDDELEQFKTEGLEILSTLEEQLKDISDEKKAMHIVCFQILYSLAILNVFAGDADSINMIQDISTAYDKMVSNEERVGVEILVEIIVSFVSQDSSLMKKLALVVWEHIVNEVELSHLQSLFDILKVQENQEGKEKLFDNKNEEVEDEDEDEGEGEDGDDNENGEEDRESVKGEVSIDEIDKKTNEALAKVLGLSSKVAEQHETNSGQNSSYEEDSEDVSMDDEQMMAIDATLANIFKERQHALISQGNGKKKQQKQDKDTVVFLKGRILDMLDTFVSKRSTDLLNVEIVMPLLNLMARTNTLQLGEKAHKLLKTKVCRARIEVKLSDEQIFDLKRTLDQIQRFASKSTIKAVSNGCNQSSIFIVKTLLSGSPDPDALIEDILKIYTMSLLNWYRTPGNKTQPGMFFDLINWLYSKKR